MSAGARRLCAIGALVCGVVALAVTVVVLWNNWAPLLGAFVLFTVALDRRVVRGDPSRRGAPGRDPRHGRGPGGRAG